MTADERLSVLFVAEDGPTNATSSTTDDARPFIMGVVHSYLDGQVLVDAAYVATSEGLVRALATRLTGADPGPLHHSCPFCGSIEHGRPCLEGPIDVSVAHAGGLTVVAVSSAGPVGVDVEVDADVTWVRREAVGKALGVGILLEYQPEPAWQSEVPVAGHVAVVALVTEQEAWEAAARTATRRTAR